MLVTGGLTFEAVIRILHVGRAAFADKYWIFGGMAVLVLLWPFFVHGWERIFAEEERAYRRWEHGRAMASLSLAMVAAWGWWLQQGSQG